MASDESVTHQNCRTDMRPFRDGVFETCCRLFETARAPVAAPDEARHPASDRWHREAIRSHCRSIRIERLQDDQSAQALCRPPASRPDELASSSPHSSIRRHPPRTALARRSRACRLRPALAGDPYRTSARPWPLRAAEPSSRARARRRPCRHARHRGLSLPAPYSLT